MSALGEAVMWPRALCPDGEDVIGRDSGADRLLLASGSRQIEHLGSAHTAAEVELLKAAARQRLAVWAGRAGPGPGCRGRAGRCRSSPRRWAAWSMRARPVYHRTRDSIEARLTIVFAALAVSRWVEHRTGWSIRKFVKTARRYRTIQIQAGDHLITQPTRYPTTCARPSKPSTPAPECALAEVRLDNNHHISEHHTYDG